MTAPDLDLDELERRAREATPGEWKVGPYDSDIWAPSEKGGDTKIFDIRGWGYFTGKGSGALGLSHEEGRARQAANGAHIVAAQPSVILALITRTRSAEQHAETAEGLVRRLYAVMYIRHGNEPNSLMSDIRASGILENTNLTKSNKI